MKKLAHLIREYVKLSQQDVSAGMTSTEGFEPNKKMHSAPQSLDDAKAKAEAARKAQVATNLVSEDNASTDLKPSFPSDGKEAALSLLRQLCGK